jgi:hypothetical protein
LASPVSGFQSSKEIAILVNLQMLIKIVIIVVCSAGSHNGPWTLGLFITRKFQFEAEIKTSK